MDIKFDHLENFRQITGTKLYRFANPDSASEADVEKLQEIGIRALVDLRSPKEVNWSSNFAKVYMYHNPDEENGVKVEATVSNSEAGEGYQDTIKGANENEQYSHHIVNTLQSLEFRKYWGEASKRIKDGSDTSNMPPLAQLYSCMLDYCGDKFVKVLRLLSEPKNVPAGFLCSLGKDRTGLVAALVESIIGWDRESICRDYVATDEAIRRSSVLLGMVEEMKKRSHGMWDNDELLTAKSATMEALLNYIDDKYGSMDSYLDTNGFGASERKKFRQAVTIHKS